MTEFEQEEVNEVTADILTKKLIGTVARKTLWENAAIRLTFPKVSALTLAVLKLTGIINWSWLIVVSPLLISAMCSAIFYRALKKIATTKIKTEREELEL